MTFLEGNEENFTEYPDCKGSVRRPRLIKMQMQV